MASNNPLSFPTPITPSMPLCPPIIDGVENLPVTPPDSSDPFREMPTKLDKKALKKALHVMSTERDALTHLTTLYSSSRSAQAAFSSTVSLVQASQARHGKIIFTGVGKSGWIAQKLVATFNSVGVFSVFLHPTEALHGDLGIIRPNDIVIMITFSGRTPELLTLLRHIPAYIPLVVLSSHTSIESCPLLRDALAGNLYGILLPAPIHITETEAFGLAAPTSSTTVALALGDSLALAIAERMHTLPGLQPSDIFARHHPGGAIGADNNKCPTVKRKMSDLAVHIEEIPVIQIEESRQIRCLDILLAAVRSPKGWVRVSPAHIISPRRCQHLSQPDLPIEEVQDGKGNLLVEQTDWISVLGDCSVEECREWIRKMRTEGDCRGREFLRPGTVLGIVDAQSQKNAVVEIEDVVGDDFDGTLDV